MRGHRRAPRGARALPLRTGLLWFRNERYCRRPMTRPGQVGACRRSGERGGEGALYGGPLGRAAIPEQGGRSSGLLGRLGGGIQGCGGSLGPNTRPTKRT